MFLGLHVCLPAEMHLDEAHRISHVVKGRLMAQYLKIRDAIIHIEPATERALTSYALGKRFEFSKALGQHS